MKVFDYASVTAEPAPGSPGVRLRWVLGANVNAPTFYLRVIDVDPGAATEFHSHAWEHEVYVLEGKGNVRNAEGTETPVVPGTCAYVAPNEVHQFVNSGTDVLRFICVIPKPSQE